MYFCEIENFSYGEINEQSFSNPNPSPTSHAQLLTSLRCYVLGELPVII